jgi:hypothetical protein
VGVEADGDPLRAFPVQAVAGLRVAEQPGIGDRGRKALLLLVRHHRIAVASQQQGRRRDPPRSPVSSKATRPSSASRHIRAGSLRLSATSPSKNASGRGRWAAAAWKPRTKLRRRAFPVAAERGGDPQADPAVAGEVHQLVDQRAAELRLDAVDDAAGI